MNEPGKEGVWQPPPLAVSGGETDPGWKLPPLAPTQGSSEQSRWTVPPLGSAARGLGQPREREFRLPKVRPWHGIIAAVLLVLIANRDNLPLWWAEVFNRTPSDNWVRGAAKAKLPAALPHGNAMAFEIQEVIKTRESRGVARASVRGSAALKEPFFVSIAHDDETLGFRSKLNQLKGAEERARFLQERGGVTIAPVDKALFTFVRESTPAGRHAPFRLEFTASRNGAKWETAGGEAAFEAGSAPAGQPLTRFGEHVAVLGTAAGVQAAADFSAKIEGYLAAVAEADQTVLKRFAAEGRDEKGNAIFPSRPLPGERYPETRQRELDPQELQSWPEDKLQYAINELFARRGAAFGNKKLDDWFGQFSWYRPRSGASLEDIENSLSDIELQNVKLLGYARTSVRENAAAQQRAAAQQKVEASQHARQNAAQQRAQQEAAKRAQEQQMGEQILRGILQGVADGLQRR